VSRRFVTLLAAGTLLLAACGVSPSAAVQPAAFNAADTMFLQMMVPHHTQGLAIVQRALTRTVRPDVRMLAAAIQATQTTEIQTMGAWLREWGQPAAADPAAHAAHGGLPGTSADELAQLDQTSDVEFERAFLNLLIAHQDDAIQLARMETAGGVHDAARSLADQIDRSRTAQIAQLLTYL
jgi:uncharacterized protein (DUF305 family)